MRSWRTAGDFRRTGIIVNPALGFHISPNHHQRPQNAKKQQAQPTSHGNGIRLWMPSATSDASRQSPEHADENNNGDRKDGKDEQGKNIEEGHCVTGASC